MAALLGRLGSVSPGQPEALGRVSTLSVARYRVTLETPPTIFQGQDAAVVVRVQTGQGRPVDGVLVVLQVDPPWARYASLRPARARTQHGTIRAIVRSDLVGRVQITVRVGAITTQATITVVMPLAMRDGHTETCAHARRPLTSV